MAVDNQEAEPQNGVSLTLQATYFIYALMNSELELSEDLTIAPLQRYLRRKTN